MKEQGTNLIALAIPFFFLFIGLELLVARRRQKSLYRFHDAITDLGCGIGSQVVLLFFNGSLFLGYIYLHEHYRFFTLGGKSASFANNLATWLITIIAVDFIYYWWHRLSHEVNLLWAAHVVHHQSEDYNLAVALRQAIFTGFTAWPFYLPLAFLGIDPIIYATIHSLNTLYQFWIHTQLVDKIGPCETFLNTPSHHRVHHGINPRYLDKNYAGIFIIWDRLFGTFEPEGEPVVYGLVKPLKSFDSLWSQIHYLVELGRDAWRAPRFRDKILIWFKSPAWHPQGLGDYPTPQEVSPRTFQKYETEVSAGLRRYVFANFVPTAVATFLALLLENSLSLSVLVSLVALILLTLWIWGGLFEGKRWALPLELLRLTLVVMVVAAWGSPFWMVALAAGVAGALGFWATRLSPPVLAPVPGGE